MNPHSQHNTTTSPSPSPSPSFSDKTEPYMVEFSRNAEFGKMEVMIPRSDFDCQSPRSSPYLSAPSSPKRFNDYFLSAPASPARMSEFYREFENLSINHVVRDATDSAASSVPFDREEKPGTPKLSKSNVNNHDVDEDDLEFAFSVSKEPDKASRPAEELFHGGKIKPLKPPPRLQVDEFKSPVSSPRSPLAQGKKMIRNALSPRRKQQANPFAIAADNTRREVERDRGRDRLPSAISSSSSGRRATRSLSPYRVSDSYMLDEEKTSTQRQSNTKLEPTANPKSSFTTTSSSRSSRKWRLSDLFLFRSASEGRAIDKYQFRNDSALHKKVEDVKNSSFRSTNSSSSGSNSRRKSPVSAHELHYMASKAASEDLKKRTYLPYKHGILGRLAFNPKLSFMN